MIVDAYPHVCPQRLPDAISERHQRRAAMSAPAAEVLASREMAEVFFGGRVKEAKVEQS